MKSILLKAMTGFLLLSILFVSCEDKIIQTRTYEANVPEYMSYEALRNAISVETEDVRPLENPGKIYFYNNYLFINEIEEGIHIIDNRNPAQPENIAFINIPGNVDLAVRGGYLYADSYVDLVVLNISDFSNIEEVGRVEGVFPYFYTTTDYDDNLPMCQVNQEDGIIMGWKQETVTEETEIDNNTNRWSYHFASFEKADYAAVSSNAGGGMQASVVGIGGSMARFTLYQNYLYAVHQWDLKVFDISSPTAPAEGNHIHTGREVETLFQLRDNLFIGTTTGMLIYGLENPDNPVYVSDFNHIRSCDPVVVENNTAYVTLRGGSACGGFDNQLDVIDITDITSPELLASHEMTEPYGLGIDNGTLFICDGSDGLKIYDAANPYAISANLLYHFSDINTYDVIPFNGTLMMIGSDGLYQYDYSDLSNLDLLSIIPVEP